MTRARMLRLLATLGVAASLIISSFASPVLGATANIDIGGGSVAGTPARAATPTQVSPGNVAGYYLWLTNEDSANLPTFFMKAFSTATPLGAYWRFANDPEGSWRLCTTTNGLECSFGAFNSGQTIFIVAAFDTPATTSNANCKPTGGAGFGPGSETSYNCVDFQFGANQGFVPGKNKSRGDAYHWYDYVATDTNADQGAQFPFCNLGVPADQRDCDESLLSVFNTTAANRRNIQATQVTAPSGAFDSAHGTTGIAVSDGSAFTCETGTLVVECASHLADYLGQGSVVNVNSEQPFVNDFLDITIQMYGVNPNSVDGVIHLWKDSANVWHEEVIDDTCPTADGPATGQTTPCFWASGSGNLATIEIWTHNNGKFGTF